DWTRRTRRKKNAIVVICPCSPCFPFPHQPPLLLAASTQLPPSAFARWRFGLLSGTCIDFESEPQTLNHSHVRPAFRHPLWLGRRSGQSEDRRTAVLRVRSS